VWQFDSDDVFFFSSFFLSLCLEKGVAQAKKKKMLSFYFSRISDSVLFLFFILISFVNFKFVFDFTLD
jgi:hypothetical protein